jgi:hypothetical protein
MTRVDEHVHVDRLGKHALQDWMSSLPSDAEAQTTKACIVRRLAGYAPNGVHEVCGGSVFCRDDR